MRYKRKPTFVEAEESYDIEKDKRVYIVTYVSGYEKIIPAEKFEAEYEPVGYDEDRGE